MASYERFDDDYQFALIEQNIYDNHELQSLTPVFCHPLRWDHPLVEVVIVEPVALMYQETLDGQRYYVLHPVSWATLANYHIVTTELHHALSLKTVAAKRRAVLKLIRICENQVEMAHLIY